MPQRRPLFVGPIAIALLGSVVGVQTASAGPSVVVSADVHAGPGTTMPVVDHLRPGSNIGYVLRRGQWLAVRDNSRLGWVQVIGGLAPDAGTHAQGRCPASDRVEAAPADHVTVARPTRLRSRLGFDRDRDATLPRGAALSVRAADPDSEWVLVETGKEALGWVRRCEIAAGRPGAAGDEVIVVRAGDLLSQPGKNSKKVMPLLAGARLRVDDRSRDWVQLSADDGTHGWFPASGLEWHVAQEHDPDYLWQTGMEVRVRCNERDDRDAGLRCGDHARIVRATGDDRRPLLLLVTDDGYWDWVDQKVSPVELGHAVVDQPTEPAATATVRPTIAMADTPMAKNEPVATPPVKVDPARTTAVATADVKATETSARARAPAKVSLDDLTPAAGMPRDRAKASVDGMALPITKLKHGDVAMIDPARLTSSADSQPAIDDEATPGMGMGIGDMSAPTNGATLSASFQTVFPVAGAMMPSASPGAMTPSTDDSKITPAPRYEVSLTTSGGGHLGNGFDYALTATFIAAGSLTSEGQNRNESSQGGQAGVSLSHRIGQDVRATLTGGYSLAFVSPGAMANPEWMFIETYPGPFGRLSLNGSYGRRISYSLRGTMQLAQDSMAMSASIFTGDAMAMLSLTDWLRAGLDGTVMQLPTGARLVAAGPSVSVSLLRRCSIIASVSAMDDGMTMWNAATGVAMRF